MIYPPTTIGKRGYTSGIFNIPDLYQCGHHRSFEFFLWYMRGIRHIPRIYQTLSHLQKIPICNDIGPFAVMYARGTPVFFVTKEFVELYTKMYARLTSGFWQSI